MKLVLLTALLSSSLAGCALPHTKATKPTDGARLGTLGHGLGLTVGSDAPDAAITDSEGKRTSLSAIREGQPALIVFYKGGWCPSCNYQLQQLAQRDADFRARGIRLIAISVDLPQHAQATRGQLGGSSIRIFSDPDLAAHEAFRVVDDVGGMGAFMLARMGADLEARSGRDHHKVAVPSLFLLDAQGKVRWAHADRDYETRPSVEQILSALDASRVMRPAAAAPEPVGDFRVEQTTLGVPR